MVQGALAGGDEAESARRKQLHPVSPVKVLCGGVFNEQSEKATFQKALIRRTFPAM